MGLNRAISQRAKSVKFKDEGKKGKEKAHFDSSVCRENKLKENCSKT